MTCEITAADIEEASRVKSDQLNADDLVGGTKTGQIRAIRHGKERRVEITLSCWHVPWRPCKTEICVMKAMWGKEPREWLGKVVRLKHDPMVAFGGENVGGIRIDGASGIKGEVSVMLNKSKGKKARRTVVEIPAADAVTETRTIHPNVQRLADSLAANGWLDDAVKHTGKQPADWTPDDFNAAREFGVQRKAEIEAAAEKSAAETAAFAAGESGGEE